MRRNDTPRPPTRPRRLATPLLAAGLASLGAAVLLADGPVGASPGEPSPSPSPSGAPGTPRDDLAKAIEVVRGIATVDSQRGEPLVVKITDPRFEAVRKAANALAKTGEVKVVDRLIDKLEEKFDNIFVDHAVHMAYRNALCEVPAGSKGEGELEKRLKDDRAWKKQVAITWVMRKRPPTAAHDALLRQLAKSHAKPAVQSAAIRSLGMRRSVAAVDELIEIYAAHEADKDRLWIDARMALWDITGWDRPTGKAWHALWQEKGKGFDPEKSRGTDPCFQFSMPDGNPKSPVEHTVPGDKVVICIDTSGSLHVRDAGKGAAIPTTSTSTTTSKCPDCGVAHWPGCDGPKERQRLEREKAAVQVLLTALRPKNKFQLVRFDTTARSLNTRGTLLEVSLHNIENARDFLVPVEASGVTKMVRGIDEAFACEDMDVLYLLTDGAPTGDVPNTVDAAILDEVIAEVRVLNRFRGVRVYPIGFRQYPAPLLELLALEQHGNVVYLD